MKKSWVTVTASVLFTFSSVSIAASLPAGTSEPISKKTTDTVSFTANWYSNSPDELVRVYVKPNDRLIINVARDSGTQFNTGIIVANCKNFNKLLPNSTGSCDVENPAQPVVFAADSKQRSSGTLGIE